MSTDGPIAEPQLYGERRRIERSWFSREPYDPPLPPILRAEIERIITGAYVAAQDRDGQVARWFLTFDASDLSEFGPELSIHAYVEPRKEHE